MKIFGSKRPGILLLSATKKFINSFHLIVKKQPTSSVAVMTLIHYGHIVYQVVVYWNLYTCNVIFAKESAT